MMAKEGSKRANLVALLSGAVAGAIMWSKRDVAKGVMSLKRSGNPGWAKITEEPEVYLTAANEEGQQALFDYLSQTTSWRLVDHIADGFFWINECEEILLLSQTPIMMGKYWTWSASANLLRPDRASRRPLRRSKRFTERALYFDLNSRLCRSKWHRRFFADRRLAGAERLPQHWTKSRILQ